MTKYYVKFESHCQAKNSAEQEAIALFKEHDGILLLKEHSRESVLKDLKAGIDRINLRHHRCGDVRFSTWKTEGTENATLGDGVCYLRIYRVKIEIE